MLSARQKICFLNGRCDTCLMKERSLPVRTGEHVPLWTGYVGEKLFSMSETIRGNRNMLAAEDSFSRYCRVFPIPNKEAHTMAKVLMDQHFNVYGLPDQLHSDNGKEFVNYLWRELFSKFKIQCTTTPPYNPSVKLSQPCSRQEGLEYRITWICSWMLPCMHTTQSWVAVQEWHRTMPCLCAKQHSQWIGFFPTCSVEKRAMYHWTGDMMEERQHAYMNMREIKGGRVRQNAQMYKPLKQNILVGCLV